MFAICISLIKCEIATQLAQHVMAINGSDTVDKRVTHKWFIDFEPDNVYKIDVNESPRSGWPVTTKVNNIMENINKNRNIPCALIAAELKIR